MSLVDVPLASRDGVSPCWRLTWLIGNALDPIAELGIHPFTGMIWVSIGDEVVVTTKNLDQRTGFVHAVEHV